MTGWFSALARTRDKISGALGKWVEKREVQDGLDLEELEESLLGADATPRLVMEILEELEGPSPDASPLDVLHDRLQKDLQVTEPLDWSVPTVPYVILVVGVNGAGKTTTCAKLAHHAQEAGRKVLLAAGDTFRAAGSDQLRIWAERVGCEVVVGQMGADTAALAFDALDAAVARQADVVIIDTAGRMHTKGPLMQELEKVRRALSKRIPDAPHETWVVLDASMGQNAVLQAKTFNESVPLTGAIVTKLDGSSKAGFLFSIASEVGIPIRFAGLGEGMEDLAVFDRSAFVNALLGSDPVAEELDA